MNINYTSEYGTLKQETINDILKQLGIYTISLVLDK